MCTACGDAQDADVTRPTLYNFIATRGLKAGAYNFYTIVVGTLTWKMTSNGPCTASAERAQSPGPQGWFSAELEHVVDEDEEIAAVEVWEAVACADCEGQIRMTAAHLVAQGWQPIPDPL